MSSPIIDRQVFTDLSWWHWALTVPLLAASLTSDFWPIVAAMVLCAAAGGYFLARLRQLRPFPVQVRIVYLGLLAIGTLPWLHWVHWVQLAGTTTMVTIGYCPLIRILSLVPPNRIEPFTASLMWRVFAKQPCAGGLIKWSGSAASPAISCCNLRAVNYR